MKCLCNYQKWRQTRISCFYGNHNYSQQNALVTLEEYDENSIKNKKEFFQNYYSVLLYKLQIVLSE